MLTDACARLGLGVPSIEDAPFFQENGLAAAEGDSPSLVFLGSGQGHVRGQQYSVVDAVVEDDATRKPTRTVL
jgi:hypothetical protein